MCGQQAVDITWQKFFFKKNHLFLKAGRKKSGSVRNEILASSPLKNELEKKQANEVKKKTSEQVNEEAACR